MKYNSTIRKLSEIKTDALCFPVFSKNKLEGKAKEFDQDLDGLVTRLLKQSGFTGETGDTKCFELMDGNAKRLVVFGLGDIKKLDRFTFQSSASAACKSVTSKATKSAVFDVSAFKMEDNGQVDSSSACSLIIKELFAAGYVFDKYKSKKTTPSSLSQVSVASEKNQQPKVKAALNFSAAQAEGMKLTRDLGNEPGNTCTPTFLAEQAKELAKQHSSMSCKVLEEKDMEKLNMGAFLSVSKGSTEPGKLIILQYKGGPEKSAPHVLVGKGITFDTGGISLKPGAQMDEMKYDMCGAASVLGTMRAIAELAPKKNIIGVIAAAENMPAGNASKPGDIVTTASGQTVEILNTDAEGRLVLCDALTYVERFKPKSVIDIATLTGACIIALGHDTSAVMSNSDDFAKTLMQSGDEVNDRAWQLPIWDVYQKQIDSPFADIQNIGGKGAGSITAACFLARFTKKYTWAHLDIAGTAWTSGANKGATGRPVPLLLNYLINHAK
jgi:leucyl aminopeptidase